MSEIISQSPEEIVVESLGRYIEDVENLDIASGVIFGVDQSTGRGHIRTVFNNDFSLRDPEADNEVYDVLNALSWQLTTKLRELSSRRIDVSYINPLMLPDFLEDWNKREISYHHVIFKATEAESETSS